MASQGEHTLLFTDIVDSTSRVERIGEAAALDLWERHDRLARDLLVRHEGREIDRTDGFFVLFARPRQAAAFAIDYHAMANGLDLHARVALHHAAVTLRENAPADVARGAKPIEVEGLAKPFAARLLGLAAPGQTLASASVRDALVGGGHTLQSHGHYRLKGVAEPVEVCELGRGVDHAFAPPPDGDKAYRVVRSHAGGLWQPRREVRHNLPAERDAFVGRGAEMNTLAAQLEGGARLVTVLGTGGTGKTRFVRRFALSRLGDWPGGVLFCDLSEARTPEGVLGAVAVAAGAPLATGDAIVQLGHVLAARGRCLVILDNVEQVLEPVAEALTRWLDRAGQASFLVTSRERLRLDGELVLPLEPLPLVTEAMELFEIRARAQQPDFRVVAANRAAVSGVVRLLDGLPLAIELAAARSRVLTPTQLVERLRDRFSLLGGARGTAARQATLRGAIDWSWELLDTAEQQAFAQCAVFEGGFTLAAAEAVLEPPGATQGPPVLELIQSLIDKSLLRTWTAATGRETAEVDEPRFGMYVSLQEYARERLDASGDAPAAEVRHGRFFAAHGTPDAIDALSREGGVKRWQGLARELDNLVVACRRAIARGDASTAAAAHAAAWAVLERQGPLSLGIALGEQVVAVAADDPAARLVACMTTGSAAHDGGDPHKAGRLLDEAVSLARRLGDRRAEGVSLGLLGDLRFDQMRIDEALAHLESGLATSRAVGDVVAEGRTLGRLATLEWHRNHWDAFDERCAAALAKFREVGSRHRECSVLNLLAIRCHRQGDSPHALDLYRQTREAAQAGGNRNQEATALGNIGGLLTDLGRFDEALATLDAGLSLTRETGSRLLEGLMLGYIGVVHEEQGRTDAACEHYEAALAIARETGNRRHEIYLLGSLGALHAAAQRFDAAGGCYATAIAAARDAQDLHDCGRLLGGLGKLHWMRGDLEAAEAALGEGENLLRATGDRVELPKLLCTRARVDLARGRAAAARAALAEAELGAAAFGVAPGSELARDLDDVRRGIATLPRRPRTGSRTTGRRDAGARARRERRSRGPHRGDSNGWKGDW